MNTLILSNSDIQSIHFDNKIIINTVREVLVEHSEQRTLLKPKVTLRPSDDTFYTAMPGGVKKFGLIGTKVIQRVNAVDQGPSVRGEMFLHDLQTGRLLAILNATLLTSIRTGCIAAITAKTFSKSNPKSLSMMGLGNAGLATFKFLTDLLPEIESIKILKYKDHTERIKKSYPELKSKFQEVNKVSELFKDSDIVMTSITYAPNPFVEPGWLTDGLLAIPVHMRGWQKCDPIFDKVFTDDHDHIRDWMPEVTGELGDVISGKIKGRENDSEKIIAYNYGIAISDIAVAKVIYDCALKQGIGTEVELSTYHNRYLI